MQSPPPPLNTFPPRARQGGPARGPNVVRIHQAVCDDTAKVVAVVVTIARGASYDQLFQQVPQLSEDGTRVATYSASGRSLSHLLQALRDNSHDTLPDDSAWRDFRQLLADIREVDAASVVFNWECCAGCQCEQFGDHTEGQRPREIVMDLMEMLLQRGHMVMCSDFSL